MSAVEAEFEREATQMLRNIGLRDVDELNYFQTSSSGGNNSSRSWKEGLRKPSEPRIRRFRSDFAVHPKVTGKPTSRPPQPSKLRPLPTISLGNDRERPLVTRTKSAPPEDGKPRPTPSPSTNDLNSVLTYIPKPVRVPIPTKKLCDVDGIQQSGTKVLYARKSSLKVLSVTSSNDTDVQFPEQTGPLRQKEADGTTTSVVPSVLYDSLERCQDVAPYSPEPLEDTKGSESPIGTKSDEQGCSKSSIPRACRFTAATTHFGGSVNHQKLRQTSNSVDLSVAATESASVKVIHPHSNKTKDLLENQMSSANPGPAVASMNVIASSTMQALSTLVDVVTSTSNKNVGNDEKQAHGVSQLSKEDDHVETKPYPTKKNTSCREKEIVSELPSPPSPSMALVSNTKKHEAALHSQNAEFCIEDGDDFFGEC